MNKTGGKLIELGEHNVFVLIADISGYTGFIKFSALEMTHAQIALSELMGAMWDAGQIPFCLPVRTTRKISPWAFKIF